MNLNDLTKIIAMSAAAYALLRVVIGKPLPTKVFNPNRQVWFFLAIGCIFTSISLLRFHTKSSEPLEWLKALSSLITEEKAPAQVIIAAFGLFNASFILGMLIYCVRFLPHDPLSFGKAVEWEAPIKYYTNLRGGLDFATLIRIDIKNNFVPVVLAEGYNAKQITKLLDPLPSTATAEEQIESWRQVAIQLHEQRATIDTILEPIRQGLQKRTLYDLCYGGLMIQYLERDENQKVFLIVVAATLSQHEVDTRSFEDHFEMLMEACRSIRSRVHKE
jgi:hypothetical protein